MEKTRVEEVIPSIKVADDVPITTSDLGVAAVTPDWTEEEERAVRRKLDWHLVPILTFMYLFCFLDRANIGNAYIEGLRKDLKLKGHEFNWALTMFFITFGIFDIPSSILMKRLGGGIWIPFLFAGFGFVTMCTAFVQDFAGLMAVRAVLGSFEGGVIPGFAFYLSLFYRRTELLFRVSLFISSTGLAGAFGGLLASGLSHISSWGINSMEIHTWRNIFFFEGLLTVLLGIGSCFFLVSNPAQCKFLNEREKYIAAERLLLDHRIDQMEPVERRHFKAAILNVNTNICAIGFMCAALTVNSLSFSMPTILKGLGWTSTKAQLMTVPPYAVGWVISVGSAFWSDRKRRRGIFIPPLAMLGVIGFTVLISVSSVKLKYMAIFLAASGSTSAGIIYLSWGINNVASPAVRAVAGGYITVLGTFAALTATWTYLPENAPAFKHGHSINLAVCCLSVVNAFVGIAYVRWENAQRESGRRDGRVKTFGQTGLDNDRVEVMLGHRHPEFRYIP